MDYGFVTGLPRSGSAWVSNYLSYGDSMFLHDAWHNTTPTDLKAKFEATEVKMAGVSDPGNVLLLDLIDKEFPEAKWVVVTRPVQEVIKACEKIKFPFTDFTKHLEKLMKTREVLRVPFKELFDRADEIGRFISPDWNSPAWRKHELKKLNVQVNWGQVSDQFKVPAILKEVETLTPNKMAYYKLVGEITNNDAHAMRFLAQAREASELYRRLNEGKALDLAKAKETLEAMATEWLVSPFVRNFSASLAPAIIACLEKYQNQKDLEHCPIDIDLLTTITYIFKGNDGVREFMPRVRELSDKILQEKL